MLIGLLLLTMVANTAWQEKSETPRRPKRGDAVIVRGCLVGSTVEAAEIEAADGASRYSLPLTYRLTGDKKLLKSLKQDHVNHMDVLKGVLKTDVPDERRAYGAKVGNTRIGIGLPSANAAPQQTLPVLEVKEIEHVDVRCR